MVKTVHDFATKLAEGQDGESRLDDFFRNKGYRIRPASYDEQRAGIDRHFNNLLTGACHTVEYKSDRVAGRTGNAFVETVSVDREGISGWAFRSRADYLIYCVVEPETIYVLEMAMLRRVLPAWVKRYPVRVAHNRDYDTHGVLVPLYEFEQLAVHVY
jgi:hypothetical protein